MTTRILLLLFPVFLVASHLGAEEARPDQPNIVIMMADDMGLGDTSAYLGLSLGPGAAPIARTLRTPNLEEFARQGVVFTDAHAPASMCSSTRYSLLTGRFAHRAYLKNQGWLPHGPNTPMIQPEMPTLPGMLQANGYTTAGVGKYHVGMTFDNGYGGIAAAYDFSDVDFTKPILDGPTHHGFDEFFGVTGNTEDPLDLEPRIYIRNDRWSFTDRSRMKRIGMKDREGRVLAMPEWDLARLGADYLREAQDFISRQAKSDEPFFLYYVPNANHFQRNPDGDYAVPDELAGTAIKGQSRYSDGEPAGEREDMVLENDVAFGEVLKTLRESDDPRWPGHKLIENTLVIFTSDNGPNVGDNLAPNQESGGLRGKKAKIWEGGIRVPFIASLPGRLEGGSVNRSVFSLTDLYATLAGLIGHSLEPSEAQDSHDSVAYWLGTASAPDQRARIFFCHLGPPYLNDALAIRKGDHKLVVDGGLALPSSRGGRRGASVPMVYYNLATNLLEEGDELESEAGQTEGRLAAELLRIHNRGHARSLRLEPAGAMIVNAGWHNLRNDVDGTIGLEFSVDEAAEVTHLGMWDDHDRDVPVRAARAIGSEHDRDRPALTGEKRRSLASPHLLQLHRFVDGKAVELARVTIGPGNAGSLEGEFRYVALEQAVALDQWSRYALTMTTAVDDGDQFHDPASYDGLSPLIHPAVKVLRSVLIEDGDFAHPKAIPAFSDLDDSHARHRLPVGPTLRLRLR